MAEDVLDDPLGARGPSNSLTPFHILSLGAACLSLMFSNVALPPPVRAVVGMFKRASLLLVVLMIAHHVVMSQIALHKKRIAKVHKEEKTRYDPLVKSELKQKPDDWEHASAHPSHFLTTRDGKPRLFPFPLGLAGGKGGGKDLWWEAGNSAHVGHFNQRETPEAREQLRKEIQAKEDARQKKAKKALKEIEKTRKRWQKRLAHLKVVSGIVVIGIFHRKLAVFCLAALIYYIFATELAAMLEPKEKKEKDGPAKKRKKIPTTPGMAMTYIYEPAKDGSVKAQFAAPTVAPSHRLTTSLDSRYAS